MRPTLALAACLSLVAPAALAAPADDARAHFAAIADGDLARLQGSYADGARLEWVGGPLNGSYATPEAIADLWRRFTTAQGKLKVQVDDLVQAANPAGATVAARVQFSGSKPLPPLRYVLTWRGDKIVAEVWQIDLAKP